MNTTTVEISSEVSSVTQLFTDNNSLTQGNTFRMQNQSQTLATTSVHSIQVQKEVVTDAVDAKYGGDDGYPSRV